jgi:hypothetical protein
VTLTLLALSALLLAGCGADSDPEPPAARDATASPSASGAPAPQPSEMLELGETATVAGFEITPLEVLKRPGATYDRDGARIEGEGLQVSIRVAKLREPETSDGDGELVVPVATLVGAEGERVRMDDFFGLPPSQAQSNDYNERYVESFQYAVIQPPGTVSKALLWFSVPEGMTPETLVIDAGAGQTAAWSLDQDQAAARREPAPGARPGASTAPPHPVAPRPALAGQRAKPC